MNDAGPASFESPVPEGHGDNIPHHTHLPDPRGPEDQYGPSGRRVRRRPQPVITIAIIAISVVMAIVDRLQPSIGLDLLFYPPLADAEPHRYLTSAFLHGGFWHLVFNMYALWLLGSALEPVLGRIRFLGLFIAAALAGNVAVMAFANVTNKWNVGVVGASGAVFGLFGAFLILSRLFHGNTSGIFTVLAVNLVLGFVVPAISWESHIGGLLAGLLLTYLWTRFLAKEPPVRRALDTLAFGIVIAALVAIHFYA